MTGPNPVVNDWLRSAYSMELGLIPALEGQANDAQNSAQTRRIIARHLTQTRQHALMLKARLERLGEVISTIKPADAISTIYGAARGDGLGMNLKAALIGYVTESFEVASYKALVAAARQAGDSETVRIAQQILHEEEQMVSGLDEMLSVTRSAASSGMTSPDENTRFARAGIDAINSHDVNGWCQCVAHNYRGEGPGDAGSRTAAQEREFLERFFMAFPDLYLEIERSVAQGVYVVFDWIGKGTHRGDLLAFHGRTIPATGKKCAIRGSTTFEIRNGKIAGTWVRLDLASLLDQIGLVPGR